MYKVHVHGGKIRKLLYVCVDVREIAQWLISTYIRTSHTITYTSRQNNRHENRTVYRLKESSHTSLWNNLAECVC